MSVGAQPPQRSLDYSSPYQEKIRVMPDYGVDDAISQPAILRDFEGE